MLRERLQSILNSPRLRSCFQIIAWILAITIMIVANVLMKGQEISFVYNNF